jgi:hypothetical protein
MQTALSDCAEAQREQVALQRETNRLLREVIADRKRAPVTSDSDQDWPTGGEYVIGPTN